MRPVLLILLIFLLFVIPVNSQENEITHGGFIRSGAFLSTGDYENNLCALFADADLNLTVTNNLSFKGFADIRLRYGQEYGEGSNLLDIREAWASYYNNWFEISGGKKIIKWGKTDFFTPLSKLNPVDYLFRSPDREDADLGELVGELNLTPSPFMKISFVVSPLWNPSILITRPMKLSENIHVNFPEGLQTGNGNASFGLRTDFILRGIDFGIQWFNGADPMPGLNLDSADFTNPVIPNIYMNGVPYKLNCLGADFETTISSVVIRGAFSYSKPFKEKAGNESVPFPQIEWVTGMDWSPGTFHVTAEYYGKKVLDYYKSPYDPLIGTEPDIAELAVLFSTPGFDPVEFARLQTEAFNRLYNNQLRQYYHAAGLRIEAETLYGKLIPSLTTMYNFSSRDFVILPSIKYKPADGICLTVGMENYSGKNGGLYNIIDDFMNAFFFSMRIDF
jgi:hypothetical protein